MSAHPDIARVKELLTAYYSCKHKKIDFDAEIIGNPGLLLELPECLDKIHYTGMRHQCKKRLLTQMESFYFNNTTNFVTIASKIECRNNGQESTIKQCMSALDSKEIFMYNDLVDDVLDFILKPNLVESAEAEAPAFTKRKTTRTSRATMRLSDFPDEVYEFDEDQSLHFTRALASTPIATPTAIERLGPSGSGSRKRGIQSTITPIPEEQGEIIPLVQQTPLGASTPQQNNAVSSTRQLQANPEPLRQNKLQFSILADSVENVQFPGSVPHSTPIAVHTPEGIRNMTGTNEELYVRALPLASSSTNAVNLETTGEDFVDDALIKEFEEMFRQRHRSTEAVEAIEDCQVVVVQQPVTYLHRHYERGILPAKLATTYENYNFFPELESYDINDGINLFIVNTITVPPFKRPQNPRTESGKTRSYRRPIEPIRENVSQILDSFGSGAVDLPVNSIPNLTDIEKEAQTNLESEVLVEQLEGEAGLPNSSPLSLNREGARIVISAVVHRTNSEEAIPGLPDLSRRQMPEQEIQRMLSTDQVMRETPMEDQTTPVIHCSIMPPEEVILPAEHNEQIDVPIGTDDRNWVSILRERDNTDIQYYEPGHLHSRTRRKRPRRILAEMEAETAEAPEAIFPFNDIITEEPPIEDNDFRIEFEEWKNTVVKSVQSDELVAFGGELSNILDTTDVGRVAGDVIEIILERRFAHKCDLIPNTISKKDAAFRLKIMLDLQAQEFINIQSCGTELEKVSLRE